MDKNGDESASEDRLMTIKEVAEYLAVHEMTLYTLLHETDLPAMKLGGQWRFKKGLLDRWISNEMNHKHLADAVSPAKPKKRHTSDS
jgi:excisionase family DNA binding protein